MGPGTQVIGNPSNEDLAFRLLDWHCKIALGQTLRGVSGDIYKVASIPFPNTVNPPVVLNSIFFGYEIDVSSQSRTGSQFPGRQPRLCGSLVVPTSGVRLVIRRVDRVIDSLGMKCHWLRLTSGPPRCPAIRLLGSYRFRSVASVECSNKR